MCMIRRLVDNKRVRSALEGGAYLSVTALGSMGLYKIHGIINNWVDTVTQPEYLANLVKTDPVAFTDLPVIHGIYRIGEFGGGILLLSLFAIGTMRIYDSIKNGRLGKLSRS